MRRTSDARALVAALALVAAAILATALSHEPPAPRGASSPAWEFSAIRARDAERAILDGGAPHPVGSAANEAVRDRIEGALGAVGWRVERVRGLACSRWGTCAWVTDLVASRDLAEAGDVVLLAAHLDSVGAGPGASDDGAGVAAVVEVARALAAARDDTSRVALAITDGEELGLLGAEVLARAHPIARRASLVVNLEARGTRGPAMLFETGRGSARLLSAVRASGARAVTSSLLETVYRLLPNDTDFTVYRRGMGKGGASGVNLAFLRGAGAYHTPRDDLAHQSAASVQHLGDQALALVRELSRSPSRPPPGEAVWLALPALGVVAWPAALAPWLVALALVLALVASARVALRDGARALAPALAGVAWAPAATALAAAAASLAIPAVPAPFVAHAAARAALFAVIGAAAALAPAALPIAAGGAVAVACGQAVLGAALAALAASREPGASFVPLLPALAAAPLALAPARAVRAPALLVAPAVVTALVVAPIAIELPFALGVVPPLLAAVPAWIAASLAPLVVAAPLAVRRRAAVLGAALAAASLVVAVSLPAWSDACPAHVNLVAEIDDAGARVALAAPHPVDVAPVRAALVAAGLSPSDDGRGHVAPRGLVAAPAPVVASLDAPAGSARLRVRSARGATTVRLVAPSSALGAIAVEGERVAARELGDGRALVRIAGVPPEGVVVTLGLAAGARALVDVADETPGSPAQLAAAVRARDAIAVPFQDGDVTRAHASVELPAR